MECELDIGGEGEPISGYDVKMAVSETPCECRECSREIPAGTEHELVRGEFEGEPINWRTCSDCMHIADAFQTEGRVHGLLWTEMEHNGGVDGDAAFEQFTSGCLTRVATASAKAYLIKRYRKWKGL